LATDENLGTTTCGQGICVRTVNNCVSGVPQTCSPGPSSTETCNNLDDDCDGTPDDGLGTTTCGQGVCLRTVNNCVGGTTQTCTPGPMGTESCNNLDDDCDGTPDDGLGNVTCGVGACFRSVAACVSGMSQTCTPGTGSAETCNGIDDDCDMATDETFPTQGQACPTGVPGLCGTGSTICSGGMTSCQQTVMPVAEVCNNGLDENCNGTVDDPMACGCNAAIDNDFDGSNQCLDCRDTDGTIFPGATERCNGRDDDCDGTIDEGFDADGDGYTTCGTVPGGGLDIRRVDCNDANAFVFPLKTTDCGAMATPTVANGVDDNCNGYTDETCNCLVTRDQDGDGANECVDCNDGNASIRPGAPEVCNGVDNDCDRRTVDNCGVSDPCGVKQGNTWYDFPAGTDQCRPDLICVSNVSTGARTCGSFCNQTTGTGLNDSCAVTEGCYRNLVDSDNLHLCSVLTTGASTTGQTCTASTSCRTGDCQTGDGSPAYCSDKCTHESGCSANTTCYAQKQAIVPGPGPQIQGYYYYSFCRLDTRITAAKNTGATCAAGECRAGADMCLNGKCAESCCQHSDCGAGYNCSIAGPSANTGYVSGGQQIWSIVPACVPTPSGATRVSGAACTANTQCRSGICDRNLNICIDLCCNSSSCPNGTTCEPVPYRMSSGAISTIRACVFSPVPARIEQR
jgi:hypothetical protein